MSRKVTPGRATPSQSRLRVTSCAAMMTTVATMKTPQKYWPVRFVWYFMDGRCNSGPFISLSFHNGSDTFLCYGAHNKNKKNNFFKSWKLDTKFSYTVYFFKKKFIFFYYRSKLFFDLYVSLEISQRQRLGTILWFLLNSLTDLTLFGNLRTNLQPKICIKQYIYTCALLEILGEILSQWEVETSLAHLRVT